MRRADAEARRQVRPVHRLQRLSGVHEHARGRDAGAGVGDRRGRDRAVRELRQADGRQARPLRPVPRVHRLSRVQDDAEADRDQAGRPEGGQARSDPRREVPALRREPGRQAGPVRRVHRVHELSGVQVRQAQDDRREVPEGRRQGRRDRRAEVEAREDVLRLLELSGLRLRAVEPADRRDVPEVRRAVSSSRRPRRSTAARCSATTKTATTCAAKNCLGDRGRGVHRKQQRRCSHDPSVDGRAGRR